MTKIKLVFLGDFVLFCPSPFMFTLGQLFLLPQLLKMIHVIAHDCPPRGSLPRKQFYPRQISQQCRNHFSDDFRFARMLPAWSHHNRRRRVFQLRQEIDSYIRVIFVHNRGHLGSTALSLIRQQSLVRRNFTFNGNQTQFRI